MLCLLSGRYPFFRAYDDMTALAQIISMIGSSESIKSAGEIGKNLHETCTVYYCKVTKGSSQQYRV